MISKQKKGCSGNKPNRVAFNDKKKKVRNMASSESPMGLALLLCDTIIEDRSTGKKSLIGLFSQIHAPKLPCIHPSMTMLVSMTGGQGEYPCLITCEHPDLDKPVFSLPCKMKFENPFQVVDYVFQLKAVRFPLPNKYSINVKIDDYLVMTRPLLVQAKKLETMEQGDDKSAK